MDWLATIPRTAEGETFLALLNKYKNPAVSIRRKDKSKRSLLYIETEGYTIPMNRDMDIRRIVPYCRMYDRSLSVLIQKFKYGINYVTWVCSYYEDEMLLPFVIEKQRDCDNCPIRYDCYTTIKWNVVRTHNLGRIEEHEIPKYFELDELAYPKK